MSTKTSQLQRETRQTTEMTQNRKSDHTNLLRTKKIRQETENKRVENRDEIKIDLQGQRGKEELCRMVNLTLTTTPMRQLTDGPLIYHSSNG